MKKRTGARKGRSQRGSALPAVLAMTIGVGALSTGYVMRNLREHGRESFDQDNSTSLYDAWSQMETVARIVNASGYDGSGKNLALVAAMARSDGQFIDMDGWPTGVVAQAEGGTGSGFFNLISTSSVGTATTRVTALVRERQSFADFNYFVNSHPLGISGGSNAAFPYSDAPEGSIHSNDRLVFYFPDRHFRDSVTAVNGFDYTAGARGPGDSNGQNNWFHGPMNDHSNAINGLTDVDVPGFTARTDNLLSLTGDWDFAKVRLKSKKALVEHWQTAHAELQNVPQQVQLSHMETKYKTVDDYANVPTQVAVNTAVYRYDTVPVYKTTNYPAVYTTVTSVVTVPVYTQQLVTAAWVETKTGYNSVTTVVVDTPAWDQTVTTTTLVATQVWISGGGGGDTGGSGGSGGVGYWETQMLPKTTTSIVHHNAITHNVVTQVPYTYTVNHPAVYKSVQTGTTQQTVTTQVLVTAAYSVKTQTGTTQKKVLDHYDTTYVTQQVWTKVGSHQESYQVKVIDGYQTVMVPAMVTVPEHKVQDYLLDAAGTVYVKGNVYFAPMTVGADGQDTHVLDGSLTIATDSNAYLQDSIQYAVKDTNNVLQTAYLNGADRTQPYTANPQYHGTSVLGIVANHDVIYTTDLPTQAEINSTILAKTGEVRVEGVNVASDGTVTQTSGGWVKMSLRRLGGMTTNMRPVSAFVDSSNAVTRGFVYGKSVFDVRQRTTPPRGFPTLNRPRVLATVLKEVK